MEWLGLQFMGDRTANGQLLIISSHNPYLVFLAFLVVCAACLATLHMYERACNAEKPAAKTVWRWVGASSLAGGIWAMHFICMLAYQSPLNVHYDLSITVGSLFIALLSAVIAMQVLVKPHVTRARLLVAALVFGSGICTMHYVGMSAMHSSHLQHYDPVLFVLSWLIAVSACYATLLLARALRSASGLVHQFFKYFISLVAHTVFQLHHRGGFGQHAPHLHGAQLVAHGRGQPGTEDGHRDRMSRAWLVQQPLHQVDAGLAGKHEVGDDEPRVAGLQRLHGVAHIGAGDQLDGQLFQRQLHEACDGGVVFNQQDPGQVHDGTWPGGRQAASAAGNSATSRGLWITFTP